MKKLFQFIICLVVVIASMGLNPLTGQAKESFTEEVVPLAALKNAVSVSIDGNNVVWDEKDKEGYSHIFYGNLLTGESKQITLSKEVRKDPAINGNTIVWAEQYYLPEAREYNWVLHSYYPYTGYDDKPVSKGVPRMERPSISGNTVIYNDNTYYENSGEITIYDLIKGKSIDSYIGKSSVLVNGTIVYISDYDLKVFNRTTEYSRQLTSSYYRDEKTENFLFNGEQVIWMQKNKDGSKQVWLVSTKNADAKLVKVADSYTYTSGFEAIGSHTAVWEEQSGGGSKLTGLNLVTGEVFNFPYAAGEVPLAFWGDKLLFKKGNQIVAKGLSSLITNYPPSKDPKEIRLIGTKKPEVQVKVDNQKVAFQQASIVKDGSTLVQFRPVFDKLGLTVKWDGKTKTVIGTKANLTIKLKIGDRNAVVNGVTMKLPVAPIAVNGNTMVPLRFVGEACKKTVIWDENLQTAYLIDQNTLGTLYYKNGKLLYEGQLKNGKMNGKGKLYNEDGSLWYDAEFKDGNVEGEGTIYYPDAKVVGEMKDGAPNGQGTYILNTGIIWYIGNFKVGRKDGFGYYYDDRTGHIDYEGEWVDNKRSGKGKTYHPNGMVKFEGTFVDDLRDGNGIEYYNDGRIDYKGTYSKGRIVEGISYSYWHDNTSSVFTYKNGEIVSIKSYDYDGKLTLEAEYKGYSPHGFGIKYYENGNRYEGQFDHGAMTVGKLIDKDGNIIYEGAFEDNEPAK